MTTANLSPTIEVVMPLRDPTAVLRQSVGSLAAQTRCDFRVCLSDNWSVQGQEYFDEAEAVFRTAGVAVRRVRPPVELGRVEHWNWCHHQSEGEWIKPLFAGDWVEPGYVAAMQAAIADHPQADIVNCSMASHYANGQVGATAYRGGYASPEEVIAIAFREGNTIGGPACVCYRKLAFLCSGGFQTAWPVAADYAVFLALAMRHGLATCAPVLAHFAYHPTRFTTNMPYQRLNAERELLAILLAASSQAAYSEIPFDRWARNRLFWRLAKNSLKVWLRRYGVPLPG